MVAVVAFVFAVVGSYKAFVEDTVDEIAAHFITTLSHLTQFSILTVRHN